jgi:hypothetical protein
MSMAEAELDSIFEGDAVPWPTHPPRDSEEPRSTPAHARSTPALVGRVDRSLEGDTYLPTKRWTRAETQERSRSVLPSYGYPTPSRLDQIVRHYETVTGEPVRSLPKRKLIAVCYAVHGEALPSLISDVYAETGTTTNLLGILRSRPAK